jgi:guanylate kinase
MSSNGASELKALGVLFVVCGPSGVGKTTLCEGLMARRNRLILSVSYTTRAPRGDEVDGVDYHFVDRSSFDRLRAEDEFLEWAEVHGNAYATAQSNVAAAWKADCDILFDIDYQGASQIKTRVPESVSVLIAPPSMEELSKRLNGRGTDSRDVIERRLAAARHELSQVEVFDYVVFNETLERTLTDLTSIYDAARKSRILQQNRVERLLES